MCLYYILNVFKTCTIYIVLPTWPIRDEQLYDKIALGIISSVVETTLYVFLISLKTEILKFSEFFKKMYTLYV